jgi:hypothetical protein
MKSNRNQTVGSDFITPARAGVRSKGITMLDFISTDSGIECVVSSADESAVWEWASTVCAIDLVASTRINVVKYDGRLFTVVGAERYPSEDKFTASNEVLIRLIEIYGGESTWTIVPLGASFQIFKLVAEATY